MEPLTTFTNAELLEDVPPFNWVKIIASSRMAESAARECSHSRTNRAHARGLFLGAYGEGWPKVTTTIQMVSQLPNQGLWKLHNPCMGIIYPGW